MSFWKKITGIEKIEKARAAEESRLKKVMEDIAQAEAEEFERKQASEEAAAEKERLDKEAAAAEKERLDKKAAFNALDPKAQATEKGEEWVQVLDTHVNKDNVRNGFFELDWNSYFIERLREEGYGLEADPEEEIVDRWFRDVIFNMLQEDGLDTDRGSGYINVVPISKNKSEVS